MSTELQGFDDLINDLTNMAAALDNGPVVNAALKAGAAPIEEQMLHNTSTDPQIITGDLHSSISIGSIKGGGKGKRITVGVHHKEKWFCILFNNQFAPDEMYDHYPADRLMHDIALALMAVQTQTTQVLDNFPTKAATEEAEELLKQEAPAES